MHSPSLTVTLLTTLSTLTTASTSTTTTSTNQSCTFTPLPSPQLPTHFLSTHTIPQCATSSSTEAQTACSTLCSKAPACKSFYTLSEQKICILLNSSVGELIEASVVGDAQEKQEEETEGDATRDLKRGMDEYKGEFGVMSDRGCFL